CSPYFLDYSETAGSAKNSDSWRACLSRCWGRGAYSITCLSLRPNPLCFVSTVRGAYRLHCHRTRRVTSTCCSTFQRSRCNTQGLDLRLQTGNLRLENGDLVFFFFYRVIYIGHFLFGLTHEY